LTVLHLAAPGPRFGATTLDELLEPLQVAIDAPVEHADEAARRLDDAFRLVLELEHDARLAVGEPVERNDAAIAIAATAAPGDALVRDLLRDLGLPLLPLAARLRHPVQVRVVGLPDLLHA